MSEFHFTDICKATISILLSTLSCAFCFPILYLIVCSLRLIGYLLENIVWIYNYLIDIILYILTQILVFIWNYCGSPVTNIPFLMADFVIEFLKSIFNFIIYPPVILFALVFIYAVVKYPKIIQQLAELQKERVIEKIVKIEEDEETLCVVCLTEQKCMLIRPCNHICLCLECSNLLKSKVNECPLCRGRIEHIERVYM